MKSKTIFNLIAVFILTATTLTAQTYNEKDLRALLHQSTNYQDLLLFAGDTMCFFSYNVPGGVFTYICDDALFTTIPIDNIILNNFFKWYENVEIEILYARFEKGYGKDFFSYTTSKPLPATIKSPDDSIIFYLTLDPSVLTSNQQSDLIEKGGMAVFYIFFTISGSEWSDGAYYIAYHSIMWVTNKTTANTKLLDYEDVELNENYTKDIKLKNYDFYNSSVIKTGYLVKNTDFKLETDLENIALLPAEEYIVTLSVNSKTLGEITDTLIVVTEGKSCDDTLRVPIVANCVVGITENSIATYLTILPNPVRSDAIISFALLESSDITFEVCDLEGHTIYSISNFYEEGEHTLTLATEDFTSGNYILRMLLKDKQVGREKFVISH